MTRSLHRWCTAVALAGCSGGGDARVVVEPPLPPASTAPPRVAGPSAGAGTIACGRATCRVGAERCCADRGTCEAIGSESGGAWPCEGGTDMQCDGRDDCGPDRRCCRLYNDGGPTLTCLDRCPDTEVCTGTSGCAEGFVCEEGEGGAALGTCTFSAPTTRCGAAVCRGESPVCLWDVDAQQGRCVRDAEPTPEARVVRCSGRADCGGELCCLSGGHTWCGGCGNSAFACSTAADCPPTMGGGERLEACAPSDREGEPAWIGACVYGAPPMP